MNFARGHPTEVYGLERQGSMPTPEEDGGGFDLRSIFGIVWRAKWKMLMGALVGVLLAAVQVASLEPTYTSTATVLFNQGGRNIVDIEDVVRAPGREGLMDQIVALRSTNLMLGVVERLDLHRTPDFNPALRPERPLADAIATWTNWRTYVPWDLLRDLGVIATPTPAVVPTPEEQEAREKLRARNILIEATRVSPVDRSNILRISVTTGNPNLSARVVNTIAQEYITSQLDAKLAATREATLWLTDRIQELEDEVREAEAAIADQEAQLALETGESSEVLRQQLATVNQALAEVTTRRATAEVRLATAQAALERDVEEVYTLAIFQESDVLRGFREQLRTILSERQDLARLVSEGHQRLEALDARAERIRQDIRTEAQRIIAGLRNTIDVARAEEAEFRRAAAALEQRLLDRNQSEGTLRQLERKAAAVRLIYDNFVGRLQETTQQEKLEEADTVVLSPAEPTGADATARNRILALGLILGTGVGFGISFLIERLNNTFRSIDQIQEMTGLQVLGTIPMVSKSRRREEVVRYALEKPSSALAESVRSLRTSLLFSRVDHPPRIVMFTSTVPEEGKSTTSLLLALTSAQMGRSAIIVDCDLRRPTLVRFFGERVAETSGIRGVLDGSLALDDAIFHDHVTGLHILSSRVESGTVINAADVLSSEKFGELLETLKERFDLVILDAPPTLSVTDARVISQRVDTTLYCVRWDSTPRETVLDGLREFSLVKPNVAGIVATMVDVDKAARYGYAGYGVGSYGYYSDPYYKN